MCNYGFEIVGNVSFFCDINGSWNFSVIVNCWGKEFIYVVRMCFVLKKLSKLKRVWW